ncbi:uncharacterized protein [Magallana gigas]|uniref:uncharacterized protein isoform X2 n=1 Tax=Magallana gigas TaxID=29159 RepID=UPI00333E3ADB
MKRTWMKGHLDRLPGADASTGHLPRLTGNCHQHLQRRRHGNRQQGYNRKYKTNVAKFAFLQKYPRCLHIDAIAFLMERYDSRENLEAEEHSYSFHRYQYQYLKIEMECTHTNTNTHTHGSDAISPSQQVARGDNKLSDDPLNKRCE